jgi:phosphoglycolate phosphatase-like HAD superfamily hydrolase
MAYAAFRHALSGYVDRHYSDDELATLAGPSEDGILRRLLPGAWQSAVERYLAEYARRHADCPAPFPGIRPLLSLLRDRRVRTGLVTGKIDRAVAITVRELDLAPYLDAIEPGSPDGDVKASSIAAIVRGWGMDAARVAYVGDSSADMVAARAAGVMALGAGWAPRTDPAALQQAGAAMVFRSVADLHDWIGSRLA